MTSAIPLASGYNDQARRNTAVVALVCIAVVAAAIGSLGAPLITAVAQDYRVSLTSSQWTLTITLLTGAVATPVLSRLGSVHRRRSVVLVTLAIVTAGSVATVVPAPFAVLLAGRAAQGVGLGLTALMMDTARQHLGERAPSVIAMLSVTTIAGIGAGYPVAGLLAQVGGVRAAYLLGVVVAAAALVAAVLVLPSDEKRTSGHERVDWFGATLLSLALVVVLLVASQSQLWISDTPWASVILAVGLLLLAAWMVVERRAERPLVNLASFRHPAVASANLIMFVSSIAMYLLFTLTVRYAQTPEGVGYGYGLTAVEAGLVLVPFSAMGFAAGRLAPRLAERISPFGSLAMGGAVVTAACVLFLGNRAGGVFWPILVMAILGLGVGWSSAVRTQVILAVTPSEETSAALSANQVLRAVGFSIGSAVNGLVLAAYTPIGKFVPYEAGYIAAGWLAAVLAVLTIAVAAVFGLVLPNKWRHIRKREGRYPTLRGVHVNEHRSLNSERNRSPNEP